MGPTSAEPITVAIEMVDVDSPLTSVVLAAALQLFGPTDPVEVVLSIAGVDEVTEEHGNIVQDLCLRLARPADLPEILLLGAAEAADRPAQARVTVGPDAAASARAVVLLGATAEALWSASEPAPEPTVPTGTGPALSRMYEQLLVTRRDVRSVRAIASGTRRPRVAVVFQHRSYWGAVATLCDALAGRPEIDFDVVALDSAADGHAASTKAFLAERGITARDAAWFLDHRDSVDVVVLDNPYDEFRPEGMRVPDLVAAGIRLVSVPYGSNAIAGAMMDRLI